MRLTHLSGFIYIKNAKSRIFESQGYLRTETVKEMYDQIEPKTKRHHKQHQDFDRIKNLDIMNFQKHHKR